MEMMSAKCMCPKHGEKGHNEVRELRVSVRLSHIKMMVFCLTRWPVWLLHQVSAAGTCREALTQSGAAPLWPFPRFHHLCFETNLSVNICIFAMLWVFAWNLT